MNSDSGLIKGYPKGSDLTIIDCIYHKPQKNEETKKWSKDTLTYIFKDNKTGEKKSYVIYEPLYTYYIAKKYPKYNTFFMEEKDVEPVTVKYTKLKKDIATRLGLLDAFYDNIRSGNGRDNDMLLFGDPRILGADIAMPNYYRMLFARNYTNTINKIKRAFIDIEVDGRYMKGTFPMPGECPINAISYLDFDTLELTTFLLDEPSNPLIGDFNSYYKTHNYKSEFMKVLAKAVGGEKQIKKYKLDQIKTRMLMYDKEKELQMLISVFKFIHQQNPDFIMAWNMAFDIPYIIERINNLGCNPADVMCDPRMTEHRCEYKKDIYHADPELKSDYADISCMSVFLDQLIEFASRRRGQSVFENYKLDYIGEKIAGVHKSDYSDITLDIAELPYKSYKRFVMYNMIDVIVQYCIEFKTSDIEYVYNKAMANCTEYKKVHRQTIYLANRAIMRFYDYGKFICGNNVNKFKERPDTKFEGAYVSDPKLISDEIKPKIMGKPVNMFHNAIDFDYTRLYPSITQQFGLAPNTQIGYIEIPQKVYDNENSIHNPQYTRSGQYIEDFTSDNYIEFAHRWFHLGNFEEVYKDIIEYFTEHEIPFDDNFQDYIYKRNWNVVRFESPSNLINVVQLMPEDRNMKEVKPLSDGTKYDLNKLFGRCNLNDENGEDTNSGN